MTPVSIPPDPYQRALKDMRLAREELREANERIKRLEAAGDEAIYPFEYAARVRIWTEAKEAKL